jgi:hypothetical protein
LFAGLVNAALTVSWVEPAIHPRFRSSSFAVGLTAGLLGIYATDLMGWLAGLAAVVGFIVLVQIIDALPSRVLRGAAAILLVIAAQMFFRSQAYKILRARQTVHFVETNLARMKARSQPLPKTIDELEKRLACPAKIHGSIRSHRSLALRLFHSRAARAVTPTSPGGRRLPGPSPAVTRTPGADIDCAPRASSALSGPRPTRSGHAVGSPTRKD